MYTWRSRFWVPELVPKMGTRFWYDFRAISSTRFGFYVGRGAVFWQWLRYLFRGESAVGKQPLLISSRCRAIRSCGCGSWGAFQPHVSSASMQHKSMSTSGGVWPAIVQQTTMQEDFDHGWMAQGGPLAGSIEHHCETVAKL